jgi:hypothetical protein
LNRKQDGVSSTLAWMLKPPKKCEYFISIEAER